MTGRGHPEPATTHRSEKHAKADLGRRLRSLFQRSQPEEPPPPPERPLARWDCAEGSCGHIDPCPRRGDLFARVAEALATHPDHCTSRAGIWRGHYGGRSCPSDLDSCDDCGVTFYNEYVRRFEDARLDPDDGWPADVYLCDCCLRARGARGERPVAFSVKDPTPEEQARWTS